MDLAQRRRGLLRDCARAGVVGAGPGLPPFCMGTWAQTLIAATPTDDLRPSSEARGPQAFSSGCVPRPLKPVKEVCDGAERGAVLLGLVVLDRLFFTLRVLPGQAE